MKKQKTPIRSLKKRADALFSINVRQYGQCQLRGLDKVKCSSVLQCAHIETRGNMALRYDQQNALCICAGHHIWYTYHPTAFNELILEFFPSQWKYVEEHKHKIVHLTREDYETIINQYK